MFNDIIKVKITVDSLFHHLSQIYTGFEMLRDSGIISLEYKFPPKLKRMYFIIQAEIDDKRVVFDLGDSADIYKELYESCDFYFKRMIHKNDFDLYDKIYPLGFNNPVFHQINQFLTIPFRTRSIKNIQQIIRFNWLLSHLIFKKESVLTSGLSILERPHKKSFSEKIIFCARVWNPDRFKEDERKAECYQINKERIGLVRALKKNFKDKFVGGIQDEPYARKICPDILLPNSFNNKLNYLRQMQECTIGIASPGIYNSIGFKFTEYISNRCAIVSSPIDEFKLSGQFEEKENYLTYRSTEECVEKVNLLFQNKSYRNEIIENNYTYYLNFVHPEKLILNVLKQVVGNSKVVNS